MSSLPSDSVPGFNVALQTAHELPLNFTARRHPIASFLCVASQIASLDAPIRCALVLHPDFPVELKTNSKCNGHIAFLPISSVRFMPVCATTAVLTCTIRESSSACSEDNGTAVVQVVVVDLVVLDVLGTRDVLAVLAISDLRPTWSC